MGTTKNLGIQTNTKDDLTVKTMDWLLSVNGENEDSMAQLVDAAIGKILASEIYAATQPTTQVSGGVWHEILTDA